MIPGEIVDVTEYRNAFQLLDRGYLERIPDVEQIEKKPVAKKAPAKKSAAKKAASKKSAD